MFLNKIRKIFCLICLRSSENTIKQFPHCKQNNREWSRGLAEPVYVIESSECILGKHSALPNGNYVIIWSARPRDHYLPSSV